MKHPNQLFLVTAVLFALSTATHAQTHPLDALSADEIIKTVQILKDNHTITGHDYFNFINLKEPPKTEVLAYKSGAPFRREAFVSFYDYAKPGMIEAVVDLNNSKVISIKNIPNAIGMGLLTDDSIGDAIVRKDPRWIAALQKRGIPIDSVSHRGIFPGDLGLAPVGHREQLVFPQYKGSEIDIEGLLAYTDYTTGKILKIVDEGGISNKIDPGYFNNVTIPGDRKSGSHVVISAPGGSEIKFNGGEIAWRNWRLRYGINNREGLVLYNIRLVDKGIERPVMYRASMPEKIGRAHV